MAFVLTEDEKPTLDDVIEHYGVKGMKWGVRRSDEELSRSRKASGSDSTSKKSLRDQYWDESPGAKMTRVVSKTGEKITVEKQRPPALAVVVGRLTGQSPPNSVSSMVIRNSSGKKVGQFQIWLDDPQTVRGEWLTIKKDSQGQGYSRAAIEGLLKAASKDPNIKTVKAQVPRDAKAAQHIYGSLGFKKYKSLGETPAYGIVDDWKKDL